jgi:hypothetical protein
VASDNLIEFGELLVAAMVAAFGDQLAGDVELLPSFLSERGRRGGVGWNGSWWAPLDEADERREGLAPRQRQSRAFERAIALIPIRRSLLLR